MDRRKVIVYACTRNLYEVTMVSVRTFLKHSDVEKVYVLIEDDELPFEVPDIIETINVSGQTYIDRRSPNWDNKAFTYMSMMRAALTKFLPDDLDVVLSLDCDTFAVRDVNPIWDTDLTGYYLAACTEPARSKPKFLYFNTGVALFNLKFLRETKKDDEIIQDVESWRRGWPEQDSICLHCRKRIYELSGEYNYCVNGFTKYVEHPRIIHYAGINEWWKEPEYKQYEKLTWAEVLK